MQTSERQDNTLTRRKFLRYEWIVFFIGAAFFFTLRLGVIAVPATLRSQPVELDDAYTYAWKAVTFRNCFLSDCTAQLSLHPQLFTADADREILQIRRRAATEIFHRYTFLHEFILSAFHELGLSWSSTLRLVTVLGSILINAALIYWILNLWGPFAAGVALLCAAPLLHWKDFHTIVPHNLALGIGVFTWAKIVTGKPSGIWLAMGTLLGILMHPLGRVYSTLSVALYFVSPARKFVPLALSATLIACAFILPQFIHQPLINERDLPFDDVFVDWTAGVIGNLQQAFGELGSARLFWTLLLWGAFITSTAVALQKMSWRERIFPGVTCFLLLALGCFSMLHVWPDFPALLYGRIWTPLTLAFIGGCGAILNILILRLIKRKRNLNATSSDTILLPILCAVLFVASMGYEMLKRLPSYFSTIETRTYRHSYVIDNSQISCITSDNSKPVQLLYLDEVPMLSYLINGTFAHEAVYYPAIAGTVLESQWPNPDYIAGWNIPFRTLANKVLNPNGEGIYLQEIAKISILPEIPVAPKTLQLRFGDGNRDLKFKAIGYEDFDGKIPIIQATELWTNSPSGWVEPWSDSKDVKSARRIEIEIVSTPEIAQLLGARFITDANATSLNWPWHERALIAITLKDGTKRESSFTSASLLSETKQSQQLNNFETSYVPICDSGSLILLKRIK